MPDVALMAKGASLVEIGSGGDYCGDLVPVLSWLDQVGFVRRSKSW